MATETTRIPRVLYQPLKRLHQKHANRFLPRWIVLVFDLLVVLATFYAAFAVRLNFEVQEFDALAETPQALLVGAVYGVCFVVFRSYSGIIRHTGLYDAFTLFQATAAAFIVALLLGFAIRTTGLEFPGTISYAAYLIHFLLAYFVLMGARVTVKTIFGEVSRSGRGKGHRAVLLGTGTPAILARNALLNDPATVYDIVAFADDNLQATKKKLEGTPVVPAQTALDKRFLQQNGITMLIVATTALHPRRRAEIIEQALAHEMEVRVVPPIDRWVHGQLSSQQLQPVRIEDLMERERIVLESDAIAADIRDKVVMISGAAGSIGAEIVRQALSFGPARMVLVDHAESDLYDLQHEIPSINSVRMYAGRVDYLVADIRDRRRMETIVGTYRPDIIYHAAAYKHVPLMERFPREALLTNVFGTKVLADLAAAFGVAKFVLVSTDKAVNPTNIMGASKRIAEMYVQSRQDGATRFVTTRFGNVLDSRGSVVPLFRKQIARGGPVTVTHPEITRFFMMISEACNLVLEAGAMGQGGEIFLFDMGEPVKIIDLARRMISLSGLEPDRDIHVQITGLRPGEKLHEEILSSAESALPTHHPKIKRARVRPNDSDWVDHSLEGLYATTANGDDIVLVQKMKEIVPEYHSENPDYLSPDTETTT